MYQAIYNNKTITIEATDLYQAKLKAIAELRIPKSKQGLLSINSIEAINKQEFKFL